jgi:hypothetical protein
MKTKIKLEQDIISITTRIQKEFPELSKYIIEMPGNNSENDGLNNKNLEDYFHSLEELVNNYSRTHNGTMAKKNMNTPESSAYLLYPPSEDIYNQGKKKNDINPEDLSKTKTRNESDGQLNEKEFKDDMTGGDLDVPGSELDDQQESIGSEDEENNYYSIGGDNHNDLDENDGF